MHFSSYLSVGTVVHGKREYAIRRVLGQGSFGITYEATAHILDGNIRQTMRYTLKEFFVNSVCERKHTGSVSALAGQEEKFHSLRERFAEEAKRMKEVCQHENIVSVNEVFEDYGTSFYVMEFLDGQSLYQYVCDRGSMPENEAIPIINIVGEALTFLHKNMINHLDVKPENIMLVTDYLGVKKPVLVDFGLARHFKKSGSPTNSLTTLGSSDGYSPIEQYVGIDKYSPEADVYALAATLLFCLSGQTPCRSTEMDVNYRDEVLPSTVSVDIKTALNRAMMRNSGDRCQTISEFLSLLPIAQSPQKTSESRTRLIDNASNKSYVKNVFNEKKIIWIVVALLLGVATAAILFNTVLDIPFCPKKDSKEIVMPDTNTTSPIDTINIDTAKNDTDNFVNENVAPLFINPPSVTPIQPTHQPATEPPASPASQSYNLGYGTYTGSMRNGKPHGRGEITIVNDKMFVSPDANDTIYAKPGDVLKGSFSNGRLTQVSNGGKTVILGN